MGVGNLGKRSAHYICAEVALGIVALTLRFVDSRSYYPLCVYGKGVYHQRGFAFRPPVVCIVERNAYSVNTGVCHRDGQKTARFVNGHTVEKSDKVTVLIQQVESHCIVARSQIFLGIVRRVGITDSDGLRIAVIVEIDREILVCDMHQFVTAELVGSVHIETVDVYGNYYKRKYYGVGSSVGPTVVICRRDGDFERTCLPARL